MRYLSLVMVVALGLFVMGCGEEEPTTPDPGKAGDALKDAGDQLKDAGDAAKDAAGALKDAGDATVAAVTCATEGCDSAANPAVAKVDDKGFCCGGCKDKFVKANP